MRTLKTFAKYDKSKGRTEPITVAETLRWITLEDAILIRGAHGYRTRNFGYIMAQREFIPVLGGQRASVAYTRTFRAVDYRGFLLMTVKDAGIDAIWVLDSMADFHRMVDLYATDARWSMAAAA